MWCIGRIAIEETTTTGTMIAGAVTGGAMSLGITIAGIVTGTTVSIESKSEEHRHRRARTSLPADGTIISTQRPLVESKNQGRARDRRSDPAPTHAAGGNAVNAAAGAHKTIGPPQSGTTFVPRGAVGPDRVRAR
jgi:hypothetical protein